MVAIGCLACLESSVGTSGATQPGAQEVEARPVAGAEVLFAANPWAQAVDFKLSDAPVSPELTAKPHTAAPEPLTDAEVEALLGRLPDLDASEAREFAFRPTSLKRPRAGADVTTPFPPVAQKPKPMSSIAKVLVEPLKILRHTPQGEVGYVPVVTLAFSAPMVPLSSVDVVSANRAPATISPSAEGEWRWLDTQTLQFLPKPELRLATRYVVRVPAGTRSALGNQMGAPFEMSFETPRNSFSGGSPGGDQNGLDPEIQVYFAQPVHASAVLPLISIRSQNQTIPFRRVKPGSEPATTVILKLDRKLNPNASVTVRVAGGVPSVHGPLLGPGGEFQFSTYPPFRVTHFGCTAYECRPNPGSGWVASLSNGVDPKAFDAAQIRVSPSFEKLVVSASGASIQGTGNPAPRTRYSVEVPESLRDVWGQRLGGNRSFVFETNDHPAPEPRLDPTHSRMLVLDPHAPRSYEVKSMNHARIDVEIYRLSPTDWEKYLDQFVSRFFDYRPEVRATAVMPGVKVSSKTVSLDGGRDEWKPLKVDFGEALVGGLGHVVLLFKGVDYNRSHVAWIQVTRLGLSTYLDDDELAVFTSKLEGGAPVRGAKVSLRRSNGPASTQTSGANGLVRFPFHSNAQIVSVESDGDSTFHPGYFFPEVQAKPISRLLWYSIDDRKLYKPGEQVRVKGWVRSLYLGKGGDIALPRLAPESKLTYQVLDAQWVAIGQGATAIDARGGFELELSLPTEMNLGQASLQLSLESPPKDTDGTTHTHNFRVEEFRRPEFEVEITPDEPYLMSKEVVVPVSAKYYSGGPLPFADTAWQVTARASRFTPPNLSDYVFGRAPPVWSSWFGEYDDEISYRFKGRGRPFEPSALAAKALSARTAKDGVHRVKIELTGDPPPWPVSFSLQASVKDTNQQQWVATSEIQVHPSELYLGLRAERAFVELGESLGIDTVVGDLKGQLRAGQAVELRGFAVRSVNKGKDGWVRVEADAQTCVFRSIEKPTRCNFHPHQGGTFMIRGVLRDQSQRVVTSTEIGVYIAGPEPGADRQLTQQKVFVLADKDTYAAGETAKIAIQSPFSPAEGVLVIDRSGLVSQERFRIDRGVYVASIPIRDSDTPGFRVAVTTFGEAPRVDSEGIADKSLPPRPAYASGELQLTIRPDARTLKVLPSPAVDAIEPGSKTSISVAVTDAAGKPVKGAEVVLIAADEAVLALAGYQLPDPFEVFLSPRAQRVRMEDSRAHLVISGQPIRPPTQALADEGPADDSARPAEEAAAGLSVEKAEAATPSPPSAGRTKDAQLSGKKRSMAPGKADKNQAQASKTQGPLKIRKSFDAMLAFRPTLLTGADGKTTVEVELPDSLTRYRIMAVAAHGATQFGKGESSLKARKRLMVRPSPPRFLNHGDRAEIPVLIQNLDETAMGVKIAMRVANAKLTGPRGLAISVPPRDRVEVRFPVETVLPGRAKMQLIVSSGALEDAAELSLPVWTPATAEAFAVYGTIDAGAIVHSVVPPPRAAEAFGGLEVTTSATALAELTDAFLYLYQYPYECSEQLASRLLGVVSLKDVLEAFDAPGLPPKDELTSAMERDLDDLRRRQNGDGGWDYWNDESVPYVSIHVTHALERARLGGVTVPSVTRSRGLGYLANIEGNISQYEARHQFTFDPTSRSALVAYALYVRGLSGEDVTEPVRGTFRAYGLKALSLEAQGWLLSALGKSGAPEVRSELLRNLRNRVDETAERAHFVTRYDSGGEWLLTSEHRTDAVVLDGLIGSDPSDPLIPKVVRGLLAHRLKGRWSNTQENVFVLVALKRYFSTFENVTPDFVAQVWLGDQFAGEQEYRGRTNVRQNLLIPMSVVKRGGTTQELVLAKEGQGRMYYRLGMKYVPVGYSLASLDRGFAVSRVYEAVDDLKDVRREADGTWTVRAGASVRVTLSMQASSQRFHVALVDKLPAGFEPLNPALAKTSMGSARSARESYGYHWWAMHWFQHQNLRDERVEAFTTQLWPGAYTYTYVARATTSGEFVVPPAAAEEMYAPETFGRSASDTVRVVAAN